MNLIGRKCIILTIHDLGTCLVVAFQVNSWDFRCVYLLSELSQIPDLCRSVSAALPVMGEACHYHHYTHHIVFLETVCKQLPLIAKGIGKKIFKSSVEEFLDPIFYALVSETD
jgi:hypothetical protein